MATAILLLLFGGTQQRALVLALASVDKLCPTGIGSNMPSGSRFALPVSASLDQWLIEAGVPRCKRQACQANPKLSGDFKPPLPWYLLASQWLKQVFGQAGNRGQDKQGHRELEMLHRGRSRHFTAGEHYALQVTSTGPVKRAVGWVCKGRQSMKKENILFKGRTSTKTSRKFGRL